MGETTGISWCDCTFNPWWGCSRVSPACVNCYADRDAIRRGYPGLWRRRGERRMMADSTWRNPIKWNRQAQRAGRMLRVFCASMADVFEDHPALPAPRARLWETIAVTPWLDWLLLTKRPENVPGMVPWQPGQWPVNVVLGVSTENQRYADARIPLMFAAGATRTFVSAEPLLGAVDLTRYLRPARCSQCGRDWTSSACGPTHALLAHNQGLHWVITGGESGRKARPSHPDWFRELRDQCATTRTAFHFKQWGEWAPSGMVGIGATNPKRSIVVRPSVDGHGCVTELVRVGKKAAGRLLDGREWNQYPWIDPPKEDQ